jgi:translation initiation factor IF-3
VRLVNERGEMVGVKTIQEALRMAEETGYDLIEIAPTAVPPVCKLGNYSKFAYEKEKKLKEARKNRGGGQVKEIRIRPKIGEHDFNVKLNAILKFLKDHHKVRVSLVFMGREMEHRDIGVKMMEKIEQQITGIGSIESRGQMYGNRMVSILIPQTKG